MMNEMKKSSRTLAVYMLARNCGSTLDAAFRKLDALPGQFAAVRIFIVENNSTDDTKERIRAYARRNPNVVADCFDDAALDRLDRLEKLGILRNRALSLVKTRCDIEPDYLLAIDADVDFRVGNLLRLIRKAPPDWAALTANGKFYLQKAGIRFPVLYYDLYPYIPEGWEVPMLTEPEMHSVRFDLQRRLLFHRYVPCRSAFGGMAVYRYDAVRGNAYTREKNTRTAEPPFVCEHIPFNRRLLQHGNIYICRDMKVLYEPLAVNVYRMILKRRFLQLYIRRKAKRILRQRRRKAQAAGPR